MVMKRIAAAKFKEQWLAILDHLDAARILVPKRGRAVARVLPSSCLRARPQTSWGTNAASCRPRRGAFPPMSFGASMTLRLGHRARRSRKPPVTEAAALGRTNMRCGIVVVSIVVAAQGVARAQTCANTLSLAANVLAVP